MTAVQHHHPDPRPAAVRAHPTTRWRVPLSRHVVYEGSDLDAAQSGLSDTTCPTRLTPTGGKPPGKVRVHHTVLTGGLGLTYLACDTPLTGVLTCPADTTLVVAPVAGVPTWRRGVDQATTAAPVVLQPGPTVIVDWPAGTTLLAATLPDRLLADQLRDLAHVAHLAWLRFDMVQPDLGEWTRLVHAVAAAVNDGLADHPLVAATCTRVVTASLLTAARHDWFDRIHTTAPSVGDKRTRAVVDWIHAHLADPITLADLAVAGCMSTRTLHRQFRRHLGMPPMSYVRRIRLLAARAVLRAGTPGDTTVTDTAARCGFGDPDTFTSWYRWLYGERPVDTLRRTPTAPTFPPEPA